MDIVVRPIREEEFETFCKITEKPFGWETTQQDIDSELRLHGIERALAAFEEDHMVGTAGAFSYSLSVPGGDVPAAGVTIVGVVPSHRRRGVLTRLMRHQLDDVRERGEPVAILWASEAQIYPRYGYGLASWQGRIEIERDRAVFRDDPGVRGRHRMIGKEEAVKILPDVYERVRTARPGMISRSRDHWELSRLRDDEKSRDGMGPLFIDVWEKEGRAEAYVLYRVKNEWRDGLPSGELEVLEAMGTSPEADREIWRFVFGVDLVERIRAWWLPLDHPLLHMITEPDRLRFRLLDALWVRIVDVRTALEARTYAQDGELVFELTDGFCGWNEDRWKLEVAGGKGRVMQTDDVPDLRMDVTDLGATYLGGVRFRTLAGAGRMEEVRSGALRRADRMFESDHMPWNPQIF